MYKALDVDFRAHPNERRFMQMCFQLFISFFRSDEDMANRISSIFTINSIDLQERDSTAAHTSLFIIHTLIFFSLIL